MTEVESKTAEAPKQSQQVDKKDPYIGGIDVAPPFLKDNHHIQNGYRVNFTSPWRLLRSLFMIHNESVNIWSHLFAGIVLLCLLISFLIMTDTIQIDSTLLKYKEDIKLSLNQWQKSINNLTLLHNIQNYGEEFKMEFDGLKANALQKYQKTVSEINSKTAEITEFLNQNMQTIKHTIKQDMKHRLADLQEFKIKYESVIAPAMVSTIQEKLDSEVIKTLVTHFEDIRKVLDSELFNIIQVDPSSPNTQHISRWPIFIFLASAVFCLWCSTIFHIFHPMNLNTYTFLLRFDFAGISLLIAGSTFPVFYYGMYCQMAVAVVYLTLTVVAAVAVFLVCLFQWIHKPGHHRYRSFLFGSFGLSMVVPLSHMVINDFVFDNHGDTFEFSDSLPYYILISASYLGGLYIFTIRCPERNNPGKYDICGHSHQIWHCFVVLGILLTYQGSIIIYESRKRSICPA